MPVGRGRLPPRAARPAPPLLDRPQQPCARRVPRRGRGRVHARIARLRRAARPRRVARRRRRLARACRGGAASTPAASGRRTHHDGAAAGAGPARRVVRQGAGHVALLVAQPSAADAQRRRRRAAVRRLRGAPRGALEPPWRGGYSLVVSCVAAHGRSDLITRGCRCPTDAAVAPPLPSRAAPRRAGPAARGNRRRRGAARGRRALRARGRAGARARARPAPVALTRWAAPAARCQPDSSRRRRGGGPHTARFGHGTDSTRHTRARVRVWARAAPHGAQGRLRPGCRKPPPQARAAAFAPSAGAASRTPAHAPVPAAP